MKPGSIVRLSQAETPPKHPRSMDQCLDELEIEVENIGLPDS